MIFLKNYSLNLFCLAFLLCFNIFSQTKKIDSLKAVLNTKQNDTTYLQTLNQLTKYYKLNAIYDSALIYANKTIKYIENKELIRTINFNEQKAITNCLAYANLQIGIVSNRQSKYTEAEKKFSKALKLYEKTNNKHGKANVLMNYGYMYSQLSNFETSLSYYYKSLNEYKELSDSGGVSDTYTSIGDINYDRGNFEEALLYYKKSLAINQKLKNNYSIAVCNNAIGNTYRELGDNLKALAFFLLEEKYVSEFNDNYLAPFCYNNLGTIYSSLGEYRKSLHYFNKTIKLQLLTKDKLGLIASYVNLGEVYNLQKDSVKALDYLIKGLNLAKDINQKEYIANCSNQIGLFFLAKKDYNKSLYYQNIALTINKDIGSKKGVCATLNNIGTVYQKQGDFQKAINNKIEALDIAQETHVLSLVKELNKDLTDIYTQLNQPAMAFGYYKNYITARDSLENKEKAKKLVQMQMQHEMDKQELAAKEEKIKTDITHKAELHKKNVFIYGAIAFIGIVLLFSFILFTRFKLIQKQKGIIEKQKNVIEIRNKNLTDSITTAKRLQDTIMPSQKIVDQLIPKNFIYYLPKETISGDFYWVHESEKYTYIALADCVGHGVSGAMMAVLGHSLLNEIVINKKVSSLEQILNQLTEAVSHSLKQNNTTDYDATQGGMAISLCCIEKETNLLHISAADQPVYVIENSIVKCIEGDIFAMGMQVDDPNFSFKTTTLPLDTISAVYLTSDGFKDQFGGEKHKKFSAARLEELLSELKTMDITQQKQYMNQTFLNWKGNLNQVDDVLVVGMQINT